MNRIGFASAVPRDSIVYVWSQRESPFIREPFCIAHTTMPSKVWPCADCVVKHSAGMSGIPDLHTMYVSTFSMPVIGSR